MINKLDGIKFSEMIISGANKLYNNRQAVNDLNVFPVPDGDTGTNMSMTANAMADTLKRENPASVGKAAERMAYATLRGARGNSGVILSQLFRGMSKSLKGRNEITAKELAEALNMGSDAAYKAVMSPTEGTILTVAREAAKGAKDGENIEEVIEAAVKTGNEALEKTTQMLPALREAGVVDAGGKGLMLIFEGALEYLKTGEITESDAREEEAAKPAAAPAKAAADIKFKYCTEFIIEKSDSPSDSGLFKETIKNEGDCMLVIDDEEVVKVHIHTNHPGFVIEEALKLGEIISLKVENMKRQHSELIEKDKPSPAKDNKKKKHAEPLKPFGFAAVCSGRGISGILADLGIDKIIEGGQSMNPSTQDILKAIARVKAQTVFVFPNNKNIIMSANQAAELTENKKVIVIPSLSIPQCVRAMMDFNPTKGAEDNEKRMNKALKSVKTGQITFAVKDTEIEGNSVKKGDILGIDEGKIRYIGTDINRVLEKMIENYADEDTEYITVYYGKDVKKQETAEICKRIEEKYPDAEVSFKKGGQPLYYYIVSVE